MAKMNCLHRTVQITLTLERCNLIFLSFIHAITIRQQLVINQV